MNIPVNLVFEDSISEYTMMKLLETFGEKFHIGNSYPGNGFGYIKANINGFNQAAVATTFFVLTDLDNYDCPIQLINEWLSNQSKPNLIFRIAIKEVEAWLLADREGFSKFTGVSIVNIPLNPEIENDPKQTLINIAKRSRKRAVREDITPLNQNAKIGPNYNERLILYVKDFWDLDRAKNNSPSLNRAFNHLQRFTYTIPNN